jgi:multimeric flavodoxin WrbA
MKNNYSDAELLNLLQVDEKTLARFKEIQAETIAEAAARGSERKKKMKILGVSGSARSEFGMAQEKSNSESLLEFCLESCKSKDIETELIALRDFDIRPCRACYSSVNTQCHCPCSCYPKGTDKADDMSNVLYDKILEADAIIFTTPVNCFKMSSYMSLFIDRAISIDGSLSPADPEHAKDKALNMKHMKFIELTADDTVPGSGLYRRFSGKVAGIITTGHESGSSLVQSSLFMTLNHYGMLFPPFSTIYAMSSVCLPTYEDKPMVVNDCYKSECDLLAKNIVSMMRLVKNFPKTDWKNEYSAN